MKLLPRLQRLAKEGQAQYGYILPVAIFWKTIEKDIGYDYTDIRVDCLCEDGYTYRVHYSQSLDENSSLYDTPPMVFWNESYYASKRFHKEKPKFEIGDCVWIDCDEWRVVRYISKTQVIIELRDSPKQVTATANIDDLRHSNKYRALS